MEPTLDRESVQLHEYSRIGPDRSHQVAKIPFGSVKRIRRDRILASQEDSLSRFQEKKSQLCSKRRLNAVGSYLAAWATLNADRFKSSSKRSKWRSMLVAAQNFGVGWWYSQRYV